MPESLRLPSSVSIDMLINIAQHIDEGIVITDADLHEPGPRIVFVNDPICRMTGYTQDELIGKTPRIFQGIETSAHARAHIRTELAAGRSCQVELTNYHKDGRAFTNELLMKPHFGDDGKITHFVSIQRNVSERNAIAEQLKGSLALLQLFLKNVPAAVAIIDRNFRYVAVSPRWLLDYRLDNRDIIGDLHYEVFPEIPDRWKELHRRCLLGEASHSDRDSFIRDDGKVDWLRWELVPWQNGIGEVDGIIIFSELITARINAEDRIRASEERLKALWNTVTDSMVVIDTRGTILEVNKATTWMFGYEEDEILGQNVNVLMPEPYRSEHNGYLQRYFETGIPRIIDTGRELVARKKDGQIFPIALTVSRIEPLNLFAGIIRDLSERVDLQKQVLEIAAQEERRIGQELHDNLQQQITGLGLLAQSLADFLSSDSSNHTARATRLAAGIKECGQLVHQLARGLIPVEVHANGLQSALNQLATSVGQQCQLDCEFYHDGNTDLDDNFTATHLYRIAQEAVTNAVKHSKAKRIIISLKKSDRLQELKISDDGIGIPNPKMVTQGRGLKIMQYRASLFGGNVIIASDANGTEVVCRFQSASHK